MISKPRVALLALAAVTVTAAVIAVPRAEGQAKPQERWFKGNAGATALSLVVKPETASKYRIQFIGRQGRVLSEVATPSATYAFKGDEGYVRAKVLESNGKAAWIQPVPVGASGPK